MSAAHIVCLARSTLTIGISRARADGEPVFDADGAGAATALRPDIDRGAVERRRGLPRRQRAPAPESGTSQQGAVTVVEDRLETGQFEWSERLPPTQATLAVGKFQAGPCTAAGHSLSGQSGECRLDRPRCNGQSVGLMPSWSCQALNEGDVSTLARDFSNCNEPRLPSGVLSRFRQRRSGNEG
jgi:hypothetical protein